MSTPRPAAEGSAKSESSGSERWSRRSRCQGAANCSEAPDTEAEAGGGDAGGGSGSGSGASAAAPAR